MCDTRVFRHLRWTISEEERLTTEEALAKAELIASEWTPYNLAAFMGTTRSHHKLQVGDEPSAVLCYIPRSRGNMSETV